VFVLLYNLWPSWSSNSSHGDIDSLLNAYMTNISGFLNEIYITHVFIYFWHIPGIDSEHNNIPVFFSISGSVLFLRGHWMRKVGMSSIIHGTVALRNDNKNRWYYLEERVKYLVNDKFIITIIVIIFFSRFFLTCASHVQMFSDMRISFIVHCQA